ncbi:hypothetical protein JYU34_016339 [Plutella xylostella]|uniref:Uncharacterized protein n=1 Tax=Plutella xylostella TaxID=51655 RepID=A0ABQ7Q2E8_PLUXY|nr:hypothetical protein JYU34_016339 [Plutella xylostella]
MRALQLDFNYCSRAAAAAAAAASQHFSPAQIKSYFNKVFLLIKGHVAVASATVAQRMRKGLNLEYYGDAEPNALVFIIKLRLMDVPSCHRLALARVTPPPASPLPYTSHATPHINNGNGKSF